MTTTASMAPDWIAMLNRSERSPSQCCAISRWPVLEIGRNSVTPSMTPSRMTSRMLFKDAIGAVADSEHYRKSPPLSRSSSRVVGLVALDDDANRARVAHRAGLGDVEPQPFDAELRDQEFRQALGQGF